MKSKNFILKAYSLIKERSIFKKIQHGINRIIEIWLGYAYVSHFSDGELTGRPVQIGRYSIIDYSGGVKIGKNVKIGYGVMILSFSTITGDKNLNYIKEPIIIGDNVEIGSNSVILPGISIGDNVTIGANSFINKNIPPNCIAAGSPAHIIKKIYT